MRTKTGLGIAETLDDPRLLPAEAYEILIGELLPKCSDWNILGPELIFRGWFTPFQVQQIVEGKAQSLILGNFVLQEPLGEGGMGRVFRARNWRIDKTVAVKVIRKDQVDDPRIVKRFCREIEALGRISHPNIVLTFDAGFEGNRLYYAMEYIPGRDLGWHVRENGPLPVAAACYYVAQIAHALQHVHESGFVHRDIKPSNLHLTLDELTVKLLDLGLTRSDFDEESKSQVTRIGTLIGTPDFIAPEQIADPHRVDIRGDLYSLGCTLYSLLAGVAPFESYKHVEKLHMHAKEKPRPIESFRSDVPAELSRILNKLLAKRPEKRFQEPADLLGAMLPLLRSSWDSNSPTLNGSSNITTVNIPCRPDSFSADDLKTQVVSPSDMEIILPDTGHVQAPAAEYREGLKPLHMAIAVLTATVALLILQISGKPRKDHVPKAPAEQASTVQENAKPE